MFFVSTEDDPVTELGQSGVVPKWTTSLVLAAVCVAHETSILPAAYSKMWICSGGGCGGGAAFQFNERFEAESSRVRRYGSAEQTRELAPRHQRRDESKDLRRRPRFLPHLLDTLSGGKDEPSYNKQ